MLDYIRFVENLKIYSNNREYGNMSKSKMQILILSLRERRKENGISQ